MDKPLKSVRHKTYSYFPISQEHVITTFSLVQNIQLGDRGTLVKGGEEIQSHSVQTDLLSVGSTRTLLYTSKSTPHFCSESTIVFMPGRVITLLSVITHNFFTPMFAKS